MTIITYMIKERKKREEKREETREERLWKSRNNSSPPRGSERVYPLGLPPTYPVSRLPLSRKRRSWEHGLCLRFRFPPACRGKGNHGNMACACDFLCPLACRGNDNHGNTPCACETLFPLPDKEKAVVGCLRFVFFFCATSCVRVPILEGGGRPQKRTVPLH